MQRGAKIAIWVGVAAVVIAAAFVATSLATDRSSFCRTCHEMVPYYEAWTVGAHADSATCIQCHVNAGLPARFAHKFVALGEVEAHFLGDTSFPRPAPPEIPNRRCEACHPSIPATTESGFRHALHAEKASCAACHAYTGHRVETATLEAAGIYNANVTRATVGGPKATIDHGVANVPGHVRVSCTRCHDLVKTGCSACHTPPTKHVNKGECEPCHAAGERWVFTHTDSKNCDDCHKLPEEHFKPGIGALPPCVTCHEVGADTWFFKHPGSESDCERCHDAPTGHFSGQCSGCHHRPGVTFAFVHPPSGEHSWRAIACVKCHPGDDFNSAYCSCHGGNAPSDD